MNKRMSLIVSITVLLLAALVVSVPMVGAQDPAPEPTPIVAEMGSGSIKVSFWSGLTGSDGTTLNEMLAQFSAEHPEYAITHEIIPWGTMYTKTQAAFVAGNPPDLMLMHASEIPMAFRWITTAAACGSTRKCSKPPVSTPILPLPRRPTKGGSSCSRS
ncbi:MAG: hypothetical protein DCC53_02795 [Chloroflexi bacterium]|nr:MAG: hypothetical protein DCC53_02795 [Chloroflexota bacterium]